MLHNFIGKYIHIYILMLFANFYSIKYLNKYKCLYSGLFLY